MTAFALLEQSVLGGAYLHPPDPFLLGRKQRGAAGGAGEHVECMGELVVDDVVASLGVASLTSGGIAGDRQRAVGTGLPDDRHG
jgi:hypothetical protein